MKQVKQNKQLTTKPPQKSARSSTIQHTDNLPTLLHPFTFIRHKKQEYLVCLSLDASNKPIRRRIITIGLLDAVQMHPREVFAPVIADRAACIVIAHNHPSGAAEPSRHDIRVTQQLVAAGLLLGVKLYDHFILTRSQHFSFKGHRLI